MKNAKMIGFGLYTPKNLVENERLQELENQKILETTQKLVSSGLDAIKHDTQLASMIKNVDDFELEYRNFIIEYLEKEKKNDEQL